jgi:tetratricopeptide (TPR) repeat protein
MRREKYNAASEECYRAIQLAPNYLPSHIRLAEIFARAGQTGDASIKYQTIAGLCIARGEMARAESLYRNALKIDTDDVAARSKLIDLMLRQGRNEDVLEQYIDLGDGMMRANQLGKAAERFGEGIRLAQRAGIHGAQAITLRHRLAEVYVRQGDPKNALVIYQEILQLSPEDERAQFYIVDLGFRLVRATAVKELDDLLVRYQKHGEPQKVVAVLESLGQTYPSEPAILERLAQVYAAMRNNEKAISMLDALGELYMNLGQKRAAADAIRKIISLNPPRVEEYKHLLQQMGE